MPNNKYSINLSIKAFLASWKKCKALFWKRPAGALRPRVHQSVFFPEAGVFFKLF